MAEKTITDREKAVTELTERVEEDLEKALAALEKLLAAADCLQGVGVAELGGFPRSLLTYVKSLYERLLRIDNELVAADLAEKEKGHEVRVAFMETRGELIRIRDALRHLYQEDQEEAEKFLLGVPRQIRRHIAEELLRMCDNTLRQMRDPEVKASIHEALAHLYPRGVGIFVEPLQEKVDRLRRVNNLWVKAQVRLEGARAAKKTAMQTYNESFPEIARIFYGFFRLIGLPEAAKAIQPSGQEKGLLLSQVRQRRAIRAGIKRSKLKKAQAPAEETADE